MFNRASTYVYLDNAFTRYWNDKILLSHYQAYTIAMTILLYGPHCNMLVFGLGNDSALWAAINKRGYTLFLETNKEWIEKIRPTLSYGAIAHYETYGSSVSGSLAGTDSLEHDPPAILHQDWDIILIDGPEGYYPQAPGRAYPIIWSAAIASEKTAIFVDDLERPLERNFSERYFRSLGEIIDRGRGSSTGILGRFSIKTDLKEKFLP